jgi:hypothetical protein
MRAHHGPHKFQRHAAILRCSVESAARREDHAELLTGVLERPPAVVAVRAPLTPESSVLAHGALRDQLMTCFFVESGQLRTLRQQVCVEGGVVDDDASAC